MSYQNYTAKVYSKKLEGVRAREGDKYIGGEPTKVGGNQYGDDLSELEALWRKRIIDNRTRT